MKYLFIVLSMLFAVKAGIVSDTASVVLSLAFLSAHLLKHYYGVDTVSAKLEKRIENFELESSAQYEKFAADTKQAISDATKDVLTIKEAQAQYNLAVGITSTRRFI